jgi:hypothetical protein
LKAKVFKWDKSRLLLWPFLLHGKGAENMLNDTTSQTNVQPEDGTASGTVNNDPAEQPGSAPGQEGDQTPAQKQDPQTTDGDPGSEPGGDDDVQSYDQPKAVKELIANRKAKQEAQRQVEQLQAQVDYYKNQFGQQGQSQAVKQPASDDQAPQMEDFDDYDKYEKERIRYEARQIVKEEWQQQQEASKKTSELKTYQQRMHEATLNNPELKEKLDKARLQWTPDLIQAINKNGAAYEIMTSDKAPEIEGYFADNPGEAFKLAQMDQRQAIKEIARIEARFENNKPASTKQTQKISQAPPPIKPGVGGGVSTPDITKMSPKEWAEYRNKQLYGG